MIEIPDSANLGGFWAGGGLGGLGGVGSESGGVEGWRVGGVPTGHRGGGGRVVQPSAFGLRPSASKPPSLQAFLAFLSLPLPLLSLLCWGVGCTKGLDYPPN